MIKINHNIYIISTYIAYINIELKRYQNNSFFYKYNINDINILYVYYHLEYKLYYIKIISNVSVKSISSHELTQYLAYINSLLECHMKISLNKNTAAHTKNK